MAKLPRDPDLDCLRDTTPSLITLTAGQSIHRLYLRGGAHPTLWNSFRYYGPLRSRFDHHLPDSNGIAQLQGRGVLYAATDIPTSVAEFFQHNRRRVNRTRNQPWLVTFALNAELNLLNLTDTFCVRIGGSMKLISGPTLHAQNWSRGFYEAYPDIHGLYYPSSLTNRPVVVLYERASSVNMFPTTTRFHRALADPVMHKVLREIINQIGYGIV